MDPVAAFTALAYALGLGLLVGLQRQRADSALAGVRTFPLITVLGTACAMLSPVAGPWPLAAGFVGVAAATAAGNFLRPRRDESPGITTEIAALLMFAVGALLWTAPHEIGIVLGGACAILLHAKPILHRVAARLGDADMRAIMQFALISLVILPVLPDRVLGPLAVLNPRQIWLMVVLVVAISLLGYVALKFLPRAGGLLVGGVLGGLISSTATTASFAARARAAPELSGVAAAVVSIASTVTFLRVAVLLCVVAPSQAITLAAPVLAVGAAGAVGTLAAWARVRRLQTDVPPSDNPSQLKSAVLFGVIYSVVLLLAAWAHRDLGARGMYAVAAVSGLTDMDAIAVSTARLTGEGSLAASVGWRAVLIAALSNVVFKGVLAAWIGGWRLLLGLLPFSIAALVGGVAVLIWW
jgi:uncharacterized membrane protein (DUF4010 family)